MWRVASVSECWWGWKGTKPRIVFFLFFSSWCVVCWTVLGGFLRFIDIVIILIEQRTLESTPTDTTRWVYRKTVEPFTRPSYLLPPSFSFSQPERPLFHGPFKPLSPNLRDLCSMAHSNLSLPTWVHFSTSTHSQMHLPLLVSLFTLNLCSLHVAVCSYTPPPLTFTPTHAYTLLHSLQ